MPLRHAHRVPAALAAALVAAAGAVPHPAAAQPAAGGPTAAGAQRLLATMRAESKVLERELARERRALAAARERYVQAAAAAAVARTAVERARASARSLPLLGASTGELLTGNGLVTREHDERASAAARLQRELDRAAATAGRAQAAVLDGERRVRAFEVALGQLERSPSDLRAEALRTGRFPAYGWGGNRNPVTAAVLDDYLEAHASPMTGSGVAFMRSGLKWNIDPRFIVAIAGAESYFGLKTCAPYNAWGWACPNDPARFDSWADAIETVSKGLRENYLDEGRTSVAAIHRKYAPPGAGNDPNDLNLIWESNVSHFLVELGGNPQDVRGPNGTNLLGGSS